MAADVRSVAKLKNSFMARGILTFLFITETVKLSCAVWFAKEILGQLKKFSAGLLIMID